MSFFNFLKRQHKDNTQLTEKGNKQSNTQIELSTKHFNKALEYSKTNEKDIVIKECSKSIEYNPKNAKAYKLRGTIYGILGDKENLIKDYQQYMSLCPNDYTINNTLKKLTGQNSNEVEELLSFGIKELESGNGESAILLFEKAIEKEPYNSQSYRYRGLTYSGMGDVEKGENDLLKAQELSPYDTGIKDDLEKVQQLKQLMTLKNNLT